MDEKKEPVQDIPNAATAPEAVAEAKAEAKTEKPAKRTPRAKATAEAGSTGGAESGAKPARKRGKKKGKKVVVVRGKRKESIARARVCEGKGQVRFNRTAVGAITNRYIRDIIMEPLRWYGEDSHKLDIYVDVHGGGMMGQAQAARTAIARALVEYTEDSALRQRFMEIDRSLMVEDARRVESKKYKGPKARARFQKSYR